MAGRLSKDVNEINSIFNTAFKNFYNQLSKEGESKLSSLSFKLDYSEYYSNIFAEWYVHFIWICSNLYYLRIASNEKQPTMYSYTHSEKQTPPATSQQTRLNKTQQPPQPNKGEYLDNTYHVQKKPTMYEKTVSEKPSYPPRAGSTQKINYKVEDNMTNSKIK